MAQLDLHLSQTTGWRALITHAQTVAGVQISPSVEEYLVSLLFRQIGAGDVLPSELGSVLGEPGGHILDAGARQPSVFGDRCLLLAGLLPERAIAEGVPLARLVEVGLNAYREYASKHRSTVHGQLADEFVRVMDVLQTLRALQSGEPCIDGLNAYHLWHELGSAHGWRVLRALSHALPASGSVSERLH